jgi:inosine-uridine nucleoside N-ribohydrolase
MQGRGVVKPPIGVTFDSDFGNSMDSLLTLALLRAMSSKGETRVISVSVTKANLKAAQAEEAVTDFYGGGPPAPGTGFGGGADKVGLATDGKMKEDTPILNAIVSRKGADGKPAYPTQISSIIDTAECGVTMRNMLLAQNDLNAVVVVDGPATNAVQLMNLYGAKPQITAKVKYLVIAAGSYPGGAPEAGIREDIAAAKKLFAEWPTPIIAVGSEVGESIPYPGSSIEKDFSYTNEHPIVDAYKAFKPMPYDAPVPGMAAALYAVHPDDGYFKLSEPGTITVLDDGRTKFTPGAGGKHRYLIADPAQKQKITELYTQLVSAKPAPRPVGGRGRGGGRGASGLFVGRGASGFAGRGGGRGASGAVVPAIIATPDK